MNSIQTIWRDFEQKIVAKDAGPAQRREMRLAFYGGAMGVLGILTAIADAGLGQDAAIKILEGLHKESRGFQKDAEEGRA